MDRPINNVVRSSHYFFLFIPAIQMRSLHPTIICCNGYRVTADDKKRISSVCLKCTLQVNSNIASRNVHVVDLSNCRHVRLLIILRSHTAKHYWCTIVPVRSDPDQNIRLE